MLMHPLDGIRLKLGRAEQHIIAAQVMVDGFIASNPYTFDIKADPEPPHYVVLTRVNQAIPDKELSCIIGDFAHNARSALDLLIYQLSDLPPSDKSRFRLQFPIFDCPKEYGKKVESYLAMVAPEHIEIIEGFQPYKGANGTNNDALGFLRTINDTDKHRIIHVVGSVANFQGLVSYGPGQFGNNIRIGPDARIMFGHGKIDGMGGFRYESIGDGVITKDGTIVARITIPPSSQVDMHPQAQISMKFGIGNPRVEGRPVMDTLMFIYDRVKEVIGKFDPAFPK